MDRQLTILGLAKEILGAKYIEHIKEMALYAKNYNADICEELTKKIRELATITKDQQENVGKGAIKYVMASFFLSSAITKTYEIQIGLYDDLWYLDPVESNVYWCPQFIFQYIDSDIAYFADQLRGKVIRVKQHELDEVRRKYTMDFYAAAHRFLNVKIVDALQNVEFCALNKKPEVKILTGLYMDKMTCVGYVKKEGTDEVFYHSDGSRS